MTPWAWSWKEPDDEAYGCECETREAVIEDALRELSVGDRFDITEARQSTDARHEGSDFIPFLRTRNKESLIVTVTADGAKTAEAS